MSSPASEISTLGWVGLAALAFLTGWAFAWGFWRTKE